MGDFVGASGYCSEVRESWTAEEGQDEKRKIANFRRRAGSDVEGSRLGMPVSRGRHERVDDVVDIEEIAFLFPAGERNLTALERGCNETRDQSLGPVGRTKGSKEP